MIAYALCKIWGMNKHTRKTMAIVLRAVDYKDSDRMITFLSRDYGLMSAKSRGAKKQTGKLMSSSSLFCCGEYIFFERGGYYGVKSCDIKHTFYRLQNDYSRFAAACLIADAASKVAQEDDASAKLFALVVNVLYALDTTAVTPGAAVCYFLQRLMYIEGLYPSLDVCVLCGAETALNRFSAENGGVVCADCARQFGGHYMDDKALGALQAMQNVLPRNAGTVRLPKDTEKKLLGALIQYTDHVLQKPLKSTKLFLDTL